MIERFIDFECNWANSSAEGTEGDSSVPDGRKLMETIRGHLDSMTPSKIEQHSFYGWKFEAKTQNGQRYEMLLQHPDSWLLIVERKGGFMERLLNRLDVDDTVTTAVVAALQGIEGISRVTTYTREEYIEKGSKSPPE